jgi:hypothetical protein
MNIDMHIQRFKYSDTMSTLLDNFAEIHRHDSRKDFRSFWDEFIKSNLNAFEQEASLLEARGFKSDPYNAMYKSARFYYRKFYDGSGKKKNCKKIKNNPYSKFPTELIKLIDTAIEKYISMNLKQVSTRDYMCDITPASCYAEFCGDYEDDLHIHIYEYVRQRQSLGDHISSCVISNKLKKTFKNRFYKIQNKLKLMNKQQNVCVD